ncbi:DUF58 domain-containing protein [Anoxybacteroides tepidamans]|uniref:DUF58 domain-containing protein n=1 Tax=Anoxybacteroides tepidamans TaxID=265948 RepID=UPI000B18B46A|nr:DUF58 domain-containing protein [Anoxybacillus tepidamans]
MKKRIQFIRQMAAVVGLLGILFSYAMFQGGFVSWFLFYSFLPFGLYSLTIMLYPLRAIKIERVLEKRRYHAGETLTITIQMTMPIFFPIAYMIVEEKLPHSLQNVKRSKTVLMPWRKVGSYVYEIDDLPRGEHIFEIIHVKMTDLLGLILKEATFSIKDVVVVYPRYVEMRYRKMEWQLEEGAASSLSSLHRDRTMAVSVREYTQGDRFSWIHWKASARKNELMTKDFEERQSEDIVVFLDRTPTELFEEMVTFTASFIRAAIKKGVQTGFVAVGRNRIAVHAQGGEAHLQRLFYHLATVTCDGEEKFARTIQQEAMQWPLSFSFCYVTSRLDQETLSVIKDLAIRNRRGVVFLIKKQGSHVTKDEKEAAEQLKKKGIITIATSPQHFTNALFEGGK